MVCARLALDRTDGSGFEQILGRRRRQVHVHNGIHIIKGRRFVIQKTGATEQFGMVGSRHATSRSIRGKRAIVIAFFEVTRSAMRRQQRHERIRLLLLVVSVFVISKLPGTVVGGLAAAVDLMNRQRHLFLFATCQRRLTGTTARCHAGSTVTAAAGGTDNTGIPGGLRRLLLLVHAELLLELLGGLVIFAEVIAEKLGRRIAGRGFVDAVPTKYGFATTATAWSSGRRFLLDKGTSGGTNLLDDNGKELALAFLLAVQIIASKGLQQILEDAVLVIVLVHLLAATDNHVHGTGLEGDGQILTVKGGGAAGRGGSGGGLHGCFGLVSCWNVVLTRFAFAFAWTVELLFAFAYSRL